MRCSCCDASGRVLLKLKIIRVDRSVRWYTLCKRCIEARRLVPVRKALQKGFPLDTLRRHVDTMAVLDRKTMLFVPMFSLDELESSARSDPARARLDVQALKSVARRARVDRIATREALKRAEVPPELTGKGPLLALVTMGIMTPAEAMVMASGYVAALDVATDLSRAIRHELVNPARPIVHHAWARVVSDWAQPLWCMGAPAHPQSPITARSIACQTIRALLGTLWDVDGRGLNLLLAVHETAWTPERHVFVCTEETCETVRMLLMHFCRKLGTAAGSAFVKSAVARVLGDAAAGEAEMRRKKVDMMLSWRESSYCFE
jgi:hypothetical protein